MQRAVSHQLGVSMVGELKSVLRHRSSAFTLQLYGSAASEPQSDNNMREDVEETGPHGDDEDVAGPTEAAVQHSSDAAAEAAAAAAAFFARRGGISSFG